MNKVVVDAVLLPDPAPMLICPINLIGLASFYKDLEFCKFTWRWTVKDLESEETVRAVTIERDDNPF